MGKNKRRSRSNSRERVRKRDLLKRLEFLEKHYKRSRRETSFRRSRSISRRSSSSSQRSNGISRSRSPYIRCSRSPNATDRSPRGSVVRSSADRCLHASAVTTPNQGTQSDVVLDESGTQTPPLILLDNEALDILGEEPGVSAQKGIILHKAVCSRWEHLICQGFKDEDRKVLFEKHCVPKNFSLLNPPEVNPEIFSTMSAISKKKRRILQ